MQKKLYVCDRCKSDSTIDGFLTSVHVYNYQARIEDSYDLCHDCFKELSHFIKRNWIVIDPNNLIYNKEDAE